ncbi:MerR family transcriptional regulator [Rhizobium helianthi]|uniref:MerR family transcriptional regulator n=1 Tax=Rhizobium helianthi TaxID=1132695 RepID=A0ABW4M0G8_9HYPH
MQTDVFCNTRNNATATSGVGSFLPRVSDAAIAMQAPLAIADMADLFGVTHRTLHFYEEKGLIFPQRLGAMRVYGSDDIRRMEVICACREIGISLVAIQELMQQLGEASSQEEADMLFRTALETRKRELTADMSTIHRQVQQIRLLANGPTRHPAHSPETLPVLIDIERQCLLLMTDGLKGAELAKALGLSSDELLDLEDRLIKKLGVANRYQAAAKAHILGILPS